ncbi:MAG: SAM-dependent methyltransferase [Opitutaceae bacterium]|nr:SAM-dependent methyltransferase [Opitutaceae bacterium]
MGSSSDFYEIFATEPGATAGVSFARFMELAMYHPTAGYYTRSARRVGRDDQADFYTATSFSPVFGELVAAAAAALVAPRRPEELTFVELGAEPGGGILRDQPHPFASYRTISLGQPFELPPEAVVFSNELFDAQPFHRVVWRGGWRELGVALHGRHLRHVELPALSPELAAWADRLPKSAPEGYHIDLPLRTVPLLERIVSLPWRGLFLAFDYGKSWPDLAENHPSGTGRTYYRQKMGTDLLARPGRQDLTCHICWDWLEDSLIRSGFGEPVVESQESFFARRAGEKLAAMMAAEARSFSPRKRMLLHLLHPANMGQKFQALHALRK